MRGLIILIALILSGCKDKYAADFVSCNTTGDDRILICGDSHNDNICYIYRGYGISCVQRQKNPNAIDLYKPGAEIK